MTRTELLNAILGGRIIWCGSCALVRQLGGMDLVNKVEIMRTGKCKLCGEVDWMRMTVELLTTDPRFRSLDEPI